MKPTHCIIWNSSTSANLQLLHDGDSIRQVVSSEKYKDQGGQPLDLNAAAGKGLDELAGIKTGTAGCRQAAARQAHVEAGPVELETGQVELGQQDETLVMRLIYNSYAVQRRLVLNIAHTSYRF